MGFDFVTCHCSIPARSAPARSSWVGGRAPGRCRERMWGWVSAPAARARCRSSRTRCGGRGRGRDSPPPHGGGGGRWSRRSAEAILQTASLVSCGAVVYYSLLGVVEDGGRLLRRVGCDRAERASPTSSSTRWTTMWGEFLLPRWLGGWRVVCGWRRLGVLTPREEVFVIFNSV